MLNMQEKSIKNDKNLEKGLLILARIIAKMEVEKLKKIPLK